MFPFQVQDDQAVRPLSEEDQQILLGLARRYGVSSLVCALSGLGTSCEFLSDSYAVTVLTHGSPGLDLLSDHAS